MERIKLTDAGSEVVFKVAKVDVNETGKWPDYDFHAEDGRIVSMPKTAADRQATRGKFAVMKLAGAWVKVSRSDEPGDNGKLFWNLGIVPAPKTDTPTKRLTAQDAANAPPRTGPLPTKPLPFDEPTDDERFEAFDREIAMSRLSQSDNAELEDPSPYVEAPPQAPVSGKAAAMEEAYLNLWSRVAERQVSIGKALGFPVDGASVNAGASTIWIALGNKGLV